MTSYAGTAGRTAAMTSKSIRGREGSGINRKRLYKIIAVSLLAVFVLIGLQAYTATLQHANNVLAENNAMLQAEIDSMESQIVEETKVTKIEKTAREKYGMVYPTSDNCITIHKDEEMGDNLAATIRKEAYN